jgi:hypothetical protein
MKTIVAVLLALLTVGAHAQVQRDDIATVKLKDGNTFALNSQTCINPGFYWWHIETPTGHTVQTGCWTIAKGRRIMILVHGEAIYEPFSTFGLNPDFDPF